MKIRKYIIGLIALGSMVSCSDRMDYNEYDASVFTKEDIIEEFTYVGELITTIYRNLDYDFGNYYSGAMLASATDESEYAVQGNTIEDFYNGAWSATNDLGNIWETSWTGIAYCNLVLDEFQGLTFDDYVLNSDYDKQMHRYENYKWEARWARAYYYFNLLRQYGGVPLKTTTMSAEEANSLARNTSDEVFEFIDSECDAIKDSIVEDYTDLGDLALDETETGRADKLAVLALKARAALYHASPLFNTNNEASLWYEAALAQQELLEAADGRKKLASTYNCLWSTTNYQATDPYGEIIFANRRYGSGNSIEAYNYPIGVTGGGGGNCPTQDLIDAYEMQATGLRYDEEGSGYDAENPYDGRDPRMALTVVLNGETSWPTSNTSAIETFYGGLNGEPLTSATPTGYYLKKFLHPSINFASNSSYTKDYHTYVIYRLAEFYLNYAEAVFQYFKAQGNANAADATDLVFTMSAREAASMTRARVNMPDFPTGMTNDAFWEKYKNERMVELVFEGHRFYDVRRWKEADTYFTGITEMKITKNDDGTFTYTRNEVSREWSDKMYFFPIPQADILKNPNLEQNSGW